MARVATTKGLEVLDRCVVTLKFKVWFRERTSRIIRIFGASISSKLFLVLRIEHVPVGV
jgi:hypothetical protein